jgi:predicted nuclease of predicted toxin-antitoxin system
VNLLADESLDRQIIEQLRAAGHEVLSVAEMEPGVDDTTVLARANSHDALLVTGDKDFGELVFRQQLVHRGVILVRLAGLSTTAKADLVAAALAAHAAEMPDAFTVVTPGAVRIRRRS